MPPSRAREADAEFQRDALPWLDDVYRLAVSLTRNEADAQDVVQDTFLRAYRSWHTFVPGSNARQWLFAIARNVFFRMSERERKHRHVALEDGDVETLQAILVHSRMIEDGTDSLVRAMDLKPALADALAALAEPFRSTVILVDVEDLAYEAAADILGVPIGTVRSRLFRGRRILQEKLATLARDQGILPPDNPD